MVGYKNHLVKTDVGPSMFPLHCTIPQLDHLALNTYLLNGMACEHKLNSSFSNTDRFTKAQSFVYTKTNNNPSIPLLAKELKKSVENELIINISSAQEQQLPIWNLWLRNRKIMVESWGHVCTIVLQRSLE